MNNLLNNDDVILDDTSFNNYWIKLFGTVTDSDLKKMKQDFLDFSYIQLNAVEKKITPFYFKTKAFKITIKKNIVNNIINTGLLVSILYANKETMILGTALTSLLNNLFEMERIEVNGKDEKIYLGIPLKNQYKTSDEWYSSLPPTLKLLIKKSDFQDFLDRLVFAGLAKADLKEDSKYLILKKGNHEFRLHFY